MAQTNKIFGETNFFISNIDLNIIMQEPKVNKYISDMKKNIAECLKIKQEKISIKATTEEGLGFTGKNLGVACQASVCSKSNNLNAKIFNFNLKKLLIKQLV